MSVADARSIAALVGLKAVTVTVSAAVASANRISPPEPLDMLATARSPVTAVVTATVVLDELPGAITGQLNVFDPVGGPLSRTRGTGVAASLNLSRTV